VRATYIGPPFIYQLLLPLIYSLKCSLLERLFSTGTSSLAHRRSFHWRGECSTRKQSATHSNSNLTPVLASRPVTLPNIVITTSFSKYAFLDFGQWLAVLTLVNGLILMAVCSVALNQLIQVWIPLLCITKYSGLLGLLDPSTCQELLTQRHGVWSRRT
jgi:hypothetical protein